MFPVPPCTRTLRMNFITGPWVRVGGGRDFCRRVPFNKTSQAAAAVESAAEDRHCRPTSFCSAQEMQIHMRPSGKHRRRKDTHICDI